MAGEHGRRSWRLHDYAVREVPLQGLHLRTVHETLERDTPDQFNRVLVVVDAPAHSGVRRVRLRVLVARGVPSARQ